MHTSIPAADLHAYLTYLLRRQALRRGQWWRRSTALAARRRRLGEGG